MRWTRGFIRLAFGFSLLSASPISAQVATSAYTLPSDGSWADIGVGPKQIQATGNAGAYAIGDTSPTIDTGFTLPIFPALPVPLNTQSHIWAKTSGGAIGTTVYASPMSNAVTTPDGANTAEGSRSDTAYSGTGSGSVIALLKGVFEGTVPSAMAQNQKSIGTTATQIVPARAGRKQVVIFQEGTTLVRVGDATVTVSTGVPLPGTVYSVLTVPGSQAVYGIVASGSQTISYMENY